MAHCNKFSVSLIYNYMSYYESHHELFQLFGGYLNQDWKDMYIWEGQEPTYQPIVRKYKTENSVERIKKTTDQLKDIIIIGQNFDYDKWVEVLNYDLNLGLRPKGFGHNHQDWLKEVLSILEEPIEESNKYFIPEGI